jgi:membrane-associated phospholipid phosphatase
MPERPAHNLTPVNHSSHDPLEPGARASLRARLRGGPAGRAIAKQDLRLYRRVRSSAREPEIGLVRIYSKCGEHAALWLALGAGGSLLDQPRRGRWGRALGVVFLTYMLNTAVKGLFQRKRPVLEDLPALIATPTKLSFPSAHASSSFAAARAYSGLLPAGPLYVAAAAMALSRVYLGVHYPSDIAAGAVLGTVCGSAGR